MGIGSGIKSFFGGAKAQAGKLYGGAKSSLSDGGWLGSTLSQAAYGAAAGGISGLATGMIPGNQGPIESAWQGAYHGAIFGAIAAGTVRGFGGANFNARGGATLEEVEKFGAPFAQSGSTSATIRQAPKGAGAYVGISNKFQGEGTPYNRWSAGIQSNGNQITVDVANMTTKIKDGVGTNRLRTGTAQIGTVAGLLAGAAPGQKRNGIISSNAWQYGSHPMYYNGGFY